MRKDENQMKLFKCYDCGHQFYVSDEDSEDIVCRNCQSDNVSPVNRKPMLMKILAFVAIATIGFGVALSVMNKETTDGPTIDRDGPTTPIDTLPKVNQALLDIIELSYKNVELEHKNSVYSFVTDCNFKDKEKVNFKYEYQLMEEEGGKIIQKSSDGKFINLKPTDTESYYFKVTISDGKNTIVTDSKQATGFTPIPVPIKPWTKEQLEEAILKRNASMEKKFIARSVKISYSNLREDEGSGPNNLQDVEAQLDFGQWASVKVINIGYNANKEIASMELEVEYP